MTAGMFVFCAVKLVPGVVSSQRKWREKNVMCTVELMRAVILSVQAKKQNFVYF
jgi:hypothetical protein